MEKVLDEDHYGLEKIKERVVEYLAVLKLTGDMRAEEAFLRTLSGEKYSSSAALLADARYYALLALFNANASRP